MKLRESGMPEQRYWESLLNVEGILDAFQINSSVRDIVEFGCGYGTFTVAAARRISGVVYSYDIDSQMVEHTQSRATVAVLENISCVARDVVVQGYSIEPGAHIDAVLLFNILHGEDPEVLLSKAATLLTEGGRILVIHWRFDPETPRGPSMDIRPRPEQIIDWAQSVGLWPTSPVIDLPPWHYGIEFRRNARSAQDNL